jgi:hypothetical protein
MAKVKYGAIVGQVSGSIGASTHGHNRFGNYIRQRSIPVQPNSGQQLMRRAVLGTQSAAWAGIGATNMLGWKTWAQNNPIVDTLGDKRILTGHMSFVMANCRLEGLGWPTFATPPVKAHPNAPTSISITATVASQNVSIAFAPSPLGAGLMLWIRACKTPLATKNYVKNLLRWVDADTVLGGTPYTCTAVATKLGALTLNERIILWVSVLDTATGLISPPLEARCTVTA